MTKRKLDESFNEGEVCTATFDDHASFETSNNRGSVEFGHPESPSLEQELPLIHPTLTAASIDLGATTSHKSTPATTGEENCHWTVFSPPSKRVSVEKRDSPEANTLSLAHSHQEETREIPVKIAAPAVAAVVATPTHNKPASGQEDAPITMKQKRNSCVDADSCSSDQDLCRICQIGEEDGSDSPLISPCRCTGSVKYVHQTCLQKWIKGNDIKSCELCKYEFKMHTKLKPFSKWEKLDMTTSERRKILCSIGFHLLAVTCVIWSLYVLIQRTAQEIRQKEFHWPFWTKLIVVAIGFVGGLVFMYVQCKVYVQLWRRLKAYNRVIYVQNNPTLTTSNPYTTSTTNKKTAAVEKTTVASAAGVSGTVSQELQPQTQLSSCSTAGFSRSDDENNSKQVSASRTNNKMGGSHRTPSAHDRDENRSGGIEYMALTTPEQQVVSSNQYQINFEDQPSYSSNRTNACSRNLSMQNVSPNVGTSHNAFNPNGNVEISVERRPDLTDTPAGSSQNTSNKYQFHPGPANPESLQYPGGLINRSKSDFVIEMGVSAPNVNSDTFSGFAGPESLTQNVDPDPNSSCFMYPEMAKNNSPVCGNITPVCPPNSVGCTNVHDPVVDLNISAPRSKMKYQVVVEDPYNSSFGHNSLTSGDAFCATLDNVSETRAQSATDA